MHHHISQHRGRRPDWAEQRRQQHSVADTDRQRPDPLARLAVQVPAESWLFCPAFVFFCALLYVSLSAPQAGWSLFGVTFC